MPPKRGLNGKFISEKQEEIREGFLTEISGFLRIAYRFWRIVPLLILIYLLWRLAGMSQRLNDIQSDFCGCPPPTTCENGGEPSKKKDNTFK